MAAGACFPDVLGVLPRVHHIFTDFDGRDATNFWTLTDPDAATTKAPLDGANGIFTLTVSNTDNNEAYLATKFETFLAAAGRGLYAKGRFQYAEGNTDDANVFFGWASAVGANLMVDDGAGPRASGSIICLEKRDGETKWRLSLYDTNGAQSTLSNLTAGSSSYITVELFVEEIGSNNTSKTVTCKIDGNKLCDNVNNLPIRLNFSHTSATEMQFGFGIKAGGATAETLLVDYLYAHQDRS